MKPNPFVDAITQFILADHNDKGEKLTEGIMGAESHGDTLSVYYETKERAAHVREVLLKNFSCHIQIVEGFVDPPKLFIYPKPEAAEKSTEPERRCDTCNSIKEIGIDACSGCCGR